MNMAKLKRTALAIATAAALMTPALAGETPVRVASKVSVEEAVSRLTSAVKKAGARVFTVVNYMQGTASVGVTLRPTTLVVFGSPKIGASALQVGQTMGLYLPLKVLAYEDAAGDVWLIYDDPADAALDHGIPPDHPAVIRMQNALKKLTGVAVSG